MCNLNFDLVSSCPVCVLMSGWAKFRSVSKERVTSISPCVLLVVVVNRRRSSVDGAGGSTMSCTEGSWKSGQLRVFQKPRGRVECLFRNLETKN